MKKMMAMLLASVMVAGTFATTAFAYTGDDVQKNTSVNTSCCRHPDKSVFHIVYSPFGIHFAFAL